MCMLDNDLKTTLISDDAAAEIGPWLNENSKKCTFYLKLFTLSKRCISCRCSQRKYRVDFVVGMRVGATLEEV